VQDVITGDREVQRELPRPDFTENGGLTCGLAVDSAGNKMVVVAGGSHDSDVTAHKETFIFDYEVIINIFILINA